MKARSEDLSEHISTLTLASDAELTTSQRVDKFFKFVDVSIFLAKTMKCIFHSTCHDCIFV